MNCLILDGQPLSMAEIEAASLAGCPVALAPDALSRVAASQCSGVSAGPHQKANPLEIPFLQRSEVRDLLVLATHGPVPDEIFCTQRTC